MSLQSFVYDLIKNDPVIQALGYTGDFVVRSHTVDTPQVRPLIVLRWQATTPGLASGDASPVNQQLLTVWAHDLFGSFARIDPALRRVRTLLTSLEGVNVGGVGEWLHTVRWEGDSDDLNDDLLRTSTRNSQYRFTGSAI